MSTKFIYSVNPRRPIIGVGDVNVIRTPRSLELTKEEVLTCLTKGTVYRRFSEEGKNERVTIGNVDRLHNDHFISEEEWKKMGGKLIKPINAPIVDEESKTAEVNEPKIDESNVVANKANIENEDINNADEESVDTEVISNETAIEEDTDLDIEDEVVESDDEEIENDGEPIEDSAIEG